MTGKTVEEALIEIYGEENAIAAGNIAFDTITAFVEAMRQAYDSGDAGKTKEALDNLSQLVPELKKAVPANVVPSSAGPVGKSPKEQYIEQAQAVVEDSLKSMNQALAGVQEALKGVNEAVSHAVTASAVIQSPDLKAVA